MNARICLYAFYMWQIYAPSSKKWIGYFWAANDDGKWGVRQIVVMCDLFKITNVMQNTNKYTCKVDMCVLFVLFKKRYFLKRHRIWEQKQEIMFVYDGRIWNMFFCWNIIWIGFSTKNINQEPKVIVIVWFVNSI